MRIFKVNSENVKHDNIRTNALEQLNIITGDQFEIDNLLIRTDYSYTISNNI